METHTIVALSVVISLYLVAGGFVFQRIEQIIYPYGFEEHNPVAVFNLTTEIEEILLKIQQPPPLLSGDGTLSSESLNAEEIATLTQNLDESMHVLALKVARYVVKEIAPRDIRDDPKFKVSLRKLESNDKQLWITKMPKILEDWDFFGSLFFAATTITTIGYGHIAPHTDFGKMITVVYALVGIPLVAAFLGGLSDRIRQIAENLQQRVPLDQLEKRSSRKAGDCCMCCVAIIRITFIFLLGATIFIGVPAWVFMWREENWTFIEGLYFSFTTLSTIGFGDYIAARNPDTSGLQWYRILIVVWIFVGLAWLSSVIGLIQAAITTYSAKTVKKYINVADPLISLAENSAALAMGEVSKVSHGKFKPGTAQKPAVESSKSVADRKVVDVDEVSNASYDEGPVYATRNARYSQPMNSSSRRASPYSGRHNFPPPARYGGGSHGMVSVAAAASTSEGDRVTMVGMLPQMLQMAMCANAAAESADPYQYSPRSPWSQPPPENNYLCAQSCYEGGDTLDRIRRADYAETSSQRMRMPAKSPSRAAPQPPNDLLDYDIPPKQRTPKREGRAFPGPLGGGGGGGDWEEPATPSRGTMDRTSRPSIQIDNGAENQKCERQTHL